MKRRLLSGIASLALVAATLFSCTGTHTPVYDIDPDGIKLVDSIPRGKKGERYVQIPNSDTILYEDEEYTEVEEVAAYVQFFDHIPSNYLTNYTDVWQCTTDNNLALCKGEFENREDFLPTEYTYTEMDLRSGYSWKPTGGINQRGTDRLVFGTDEWGDVRLVVVTYDHYRNYSQYLCYYGGWGGEFGDDYDEYYDVGVNYYVDVDGMTVEYWE